MLISSTDISLSKFFSSTRAVRVFWHFLSIIEYWVILRRPLGGLNMSTGDHSCTLIFSKMSTPNPDPAKWLLKQQNAFQYREISEFAADSREKVIILVLNRVVYSS